MHLNIRRVSIENLEAVVEVEARCFPSAEAATKTSFEQRIKVFPEKFFLAEIDGKIIGFINGCIINETAIYDELYNDAELHVSDGDFQTVFGLDVIPEYRNQGIAAQLMNHMIEASKLEERKGVILTCKEKLIHYYTKFGFVNTGTSKSVHGGSKWYNMILEF
ncbi:GNAT family N-acetyltransferase [Acetobacterium tundrae]|uniref:GNAT family N-acetyltransferase n=1 Tax=Acetobacterium tundrae TaxID=132932 RepID=A0ABR6WIW6_9FIRM|nr:GNAT family N-acetyltransferase [Acetobacterium tundrae]MBC3796105.1 GNAT family N-acetyltransferase [Acetobacterium tundrae]